MIRSKRMTLRYDGGPMDGETVTLMVGRGTVGVTVETVSPEGSVRHNYVVVRGEKRVPLHLMYTDTEDKNCAGDRPGE